MNEQHPTLKLSIVMPVYNEEPTLRRIVQEVNAVDLSSLRLERELVVVDDSSTDKSPDIAQELLDEGLVHRVIQHDRNQGKGAALRSGIEAVTGDLVVIQDADLEYNPSDYLILLEPIVQGRADVVFGSRFLTGQSHRVLFFWHSASNKFLTLLSNMTTNLNLSDIETGYKAFRTDIVKRIRIEENRFGFEPEITAKVARLARKEDIRIYEVGISYDGRTYSEGKKITWKDGVSALRCIAKYGLFRR